MSENNTITSHQHKEEKISVRRTTEERERGRRKKEQNKKKTNTEGMMYCKKQKNEIDKATNQTKNGNVINDNGFTKDRSKNIGLGKYDVERILRECQRKGEVYPPMNVLEMFRDTLAGLEIKESGVAKWCKRKVRGLWLKKGYKVRKGMVIGVYGGKLTIKVGLYVLQLEYDDGEKFRVDAEGLEDDGGIFGMINEDIHNREINAHFEEMGLIRIVKNLIGPIEILTDYGEEYDWDELKWIGFETLKEDMAALEPWARELKATSMKEERKGTRMEKYMARIIDGEKEDEGLQSTKSPEGEEATLEMMLTAGERME